MWGNSFSQTAVTPKMLTETAIKAAKPREKPYKLYDDRGLYMLLSPAGGRWWRLKYRIEGKEKLLSLGVYPDVSLKQARDRRDAARKHVADHIDPGAKRRAEKAAAVDSFEAVAREWFEKFSKNWAASHSDKIIRRLELYIFPWIGDRSISKIEAPEILACLRRVEAKGNFETAHRALQNCGRVFRYAVATGRASRDPSSDLRGALAPADEKHLASFTDPRRFAELLRAIDSYEGSIIVRSALRLAPLVFVRPGELRAAEWTEIQFDNREWRIRAERMKMRQLHIVPLSNQAIKILREIQPLTGDGRFVFQSARSNKRPLSDNGLLAALRRMGFEQGTVTVHGFRSTASTLLNEQGWNRDAIERQLAHGERDAVRAVYNYAEHLPERRKMMQAWADYLDTLKAGAR
jgi:integrase